MCGARVGVCSNNATKSFMRRFLTWARAAHDRGVHLDDQSFFDKYLQISHHVAPDHAVGNADGAISLEAKQRRGNAIADLVMTERCIEYIPNEAKKMFSWDPEPVSLGAAWRPAPDELSIRVCPLNSVLFPIRPVYQRSKPHENIAHRPFLVHYNWEVQLSAKLAHMQNDGFWYV